MEYTRQEKFVSKFVSNAENFQKKIKNKKIAIIGVGGIGSVLCELLVRGGFLNLLIIDKDIVDSSNLQRQIYLKEDIGKTKIIALENRLKKINEKVNLEKYEILLNYDNIDKVCENVDLILDATDNLKIRNIINDYCEKNEKDWIYNGAIESEVVSFIFKYSIKNKKYDKVLNMLEGIENENCEQGVLSSTTFISASLAYNQVLKYFLNIKEEKFIKLDVWNNKGYFLDI